MRSLPARRSMRKQVDTGCSRTRVPAICPPPRHPAQPGLRRPYSTCSTYELGPQASKRLSENFPVCCSLTLTPLASLRAPFAGGRHVQSWGTLPWGLCCVEGSMTLFLLVTHKIQQRSCWSSAVTWAGVDGRGERGGEGKRRCGEELGGWMHVGGIV